MTNARRLRLAADVALGYAADESGRGIAFAAIATGTASRTVRLPFAAKPMAGLDGRETGYAAVAAVAAHLRKNGFGRVRLKLSDPAVVAELSAAAPPPRALGMAYVSLRCLLRGLGAVRLEVAESLEVRDLAGRAQAEVSLHAAA